MKALPSAKTKLLLLLATAFALSIALAVPAFADTSTGTQGQPNQSCQAVFNVQNPPFPSPAPQGFNTAGFNHATTVYAGSGHTNTSANSHAVSQYDVACFQTASHVP